MQRVTPDIGMAFQAVEDELRDTFILTLFQGSTSHIPGWEITGLPVKQSEITLPDPTQTAGENWTASYVITGHLVVALRGTAEFRLGDHALLIGEKREDIRRRHAEVTETALGESWAAASKTDA